MRPRQIAKTAELLSQTTCNWFLCPDDFTLPVESPPGSTKQTRNFTNSNVIILTSVDARIPLDYKVVHQIPRGLTVSIYCFNQVPLISLEPNHDQSTTCQLSPAYWSILSYDYTIKVLWHEAFIPKEKHICFSGLWQNSVGLADISEDPCYHSTYNQDMKMDPTYDPNSPDEQHSFSQYLDSILLKLTSYLSPACQHHNLFV
ncbi:LOW QUALITY PROTEIN: ankyrin and armadillo repeat-containing protein [Polymixia lowei]